MDPSAFNRVGRRHRGGWTLGLAAMVLALSLVAAGPAPAKTRLLRTAGPAAAKTHLLPAAGPMALPTVTITAGAAAVPTFSSINSTSGPVAGGEMVTISGSGLTG